MSLIDRSINPPALPYDSKFGLMTSINDCNRTYFRQQVIAVKTAQHSLIS